MSPEPVLDQVNESPSSTAPTKKVITNLGNEPTYSYALASQPEFFTYPNPVHDNTLKFKLLGLNRPEKFHFEIIEVTGRVLYKKEILIKEGIEYDVQLEKTTGSNLLILKLYNEEHSFIKRIVLSK